jgi:hypothetical protein
MGGASVLGGFAAYLYSVSSRRARLHTNNTHGATARFAVTPLSLNNTRVLGEDNSSTPHRRRRITSTVKATALYNHNQRSSTQVIDLFTMLVNFAVVFTQ